MLNIIESPPSISKKRVKTGCLNCREKHKKCDECKPICGLCLKRNELCHWPPPKDKVTNDSFRIVKVSGNNNPHNNHNKPRNYPTPHVKNQLLNQYVPQDSYNPNANNLPLLYNHQSVLLPKLNDYPSDHFLATNRYQGDNNNNSISPNLPNLVINSNDKSSLQIPHQEDVNRNLQDSSHSPLQSFKLNTMESNKSIDDDNNNKPNPKPQSAPEFKSLSSPDQSHCSVPDKSESASSPISSDSLMAPFLNYSHLHRTFRDYMVTSVANSSTIKYKDISETNFKNLLKSPIPNFLNISKSEVNDDEQPLKLSSNSLENFKISNKSNPTNTPKTLHEFLNDHGFFDLLFKETLEDGGKNVTLSDSDKLKLYKTYIYEIAPWLDIFDNNHKQFGTIIPNLAKTNDLLMNSILALTSRHLERIDSNYSPQKTIKLYQDTLKALLPTVNKTLNTCVIATCVILCVFEMMSTDNPKKWRYHLEECGALFKIQNINGFCDDPLKRGLFWCFARMDVNSVKIGEQSTIIPSEHWLPNNNNINDLKRLFNDELKNNNNDDMYANYMVYLCSRVSNLIANTKTNYEKEWDVLWSEVNDWYNNRPESFKPIMTFNNSPFPGILYVNGAPIATNQMYHMAIILLTQNKPRLRKILYLDHVKPTIWHAKQICAISLHNENHGAWNCALQPLWIAGQLLSSDQEHEIVLSLLHRIEASTGWQMNFRAKDLEKHWNGEESNSDDEKDVSEQINQGRHEQGDEQQHDQQDQQRSVLNGKDHKINIYDSDDHNDKINEQ